MLVVEVGEYIGTWLMNHDGSTGILQVEGVGDPEDPEFAIQARYVDADGQVYPVDGIGIDVHKLSFIVHFTEHSQLFRGYLFTGTKDALAGYTIRGEERYGWFAILDDSRLIIE
jgi:hypothetical protein